MNRETVAENLKELRQKKGLTQTEIAEVLGISTAAWSMYESGRRVPRDDLKVQIAKYFGRTVQTIFFR